MKKIVSLLLCAALMAVLLCPAAAYSGQELDTADALFHLRLFLGTGQTYDLDGALTREQGITLLVRMLGREEDALREKRSHPFTDVNAWAQDYVGYAYCAGLTNGISQTLFAGTSPMTAQMFVTLCLRALGYSDSGAEAEFVWNDSIRFAAQKGILESAQEIPALTRGGAVEIFWRVLCAQMKTGEKTLAEDLISRGVFSEEEFDRAEQIRIYGRDASEESGETAEQTEGNKPPVTPTEGEPGEGVTYLQFQAMTASERTAIKSQFASVAEYKAWFDRIRAEYEQSQNIVFVDDGGITGA